MKSTKLILAFFAMIIFASGINAQADPASAKKGGKVVAAEGIKPELKDDRTPAPAPRKGKEVKVAPSQAQGADMKQAETGEKSAKPAPRPATDKPKAKKATAPAEKQ